MRYKLRGAPIEGWLEIWLSTSDGIQIYVAVIFTQHVLSFALQVSIMFLFQVNLILFMRWKKDRFAVVCF